MKISGLWTGIICIVFGILVLLFPDILRWLLGIFLIVIGILARFTIPPGEEMRSNFLNIKIGLAGSGEVKH